MLRFFKDCLQIEEERHKSYYHGGLINSRPRQFDHSVCCGRQAFKEGEWTVITDKIVLLELHIIKT